MTVFAKKFLLALTIVTIGLTGCTKKPVRPDPSLTSTGSDIGGDFGGSETLGPTLIDDNDRIWDTGTPPIGGRNIDYEDDAIIRGLLEPVYFDFDKSGINASERAKLDAAIEYLNAVPEHRLLLEGHCDWKGTADYNLGLGDRRAGAAREYLEIAGVASSRIETASKGDLESIENGDDAQAAQDRRVELIVLKR